MATTDAPVSPPMVRQELLCSPVLEQAPGVASVLDKLVRADALTVEAVVELVGVLAGGCTEIGQVRLEQWVGIVARQTRMDRRLLLRLCRRLERYPRLVAAAGQGRVSFAQLRGIWLRIRDADPRLDAVVDARIGAVVTQLEDDLDPDVLLEQVERALAEAAPEQLVAREQAAHRQRFLYLQPTLDRTGGRVSGFFDAAGLALLDEASAPRPHQRGDARSLGQLRADNLLERLAHVCETDTSCGCTDPPVSSTPDTADPDSPAHDATDVVQPLSRNGRRPAPKLLVHISIWMHCWTAPASPRRC